MKHDVIRASTLQLTDLTNRHLHSNFQGKKKKKEKKNNIRRTETRKWTSGTY